MSDGKAYKEAIADHATRHTRDVRDDFANAADNKYEGGGIRSRDFDKPDYEAMLSPLAMEFYAEYMFYCSFLPGGQRREEDNWQRGIPLARWMKSLMRHVFVLHKHHRADFPQRSSELKMEQAFANCAIIFNGFGYLHKFLEDHPGMLRVLKEENASRVRSYETENLKRDLYQGQQNKNNGPR